MFPGVDEDVIGMILSSNKGAVRATIDQLLDMTIDSQNNGSDRSHLLSDSVPTHSGQHDRPYLGTCSDRPYQPSYIFQAPSEQSDRPTLFSHRSHMPTALIGESVHTPIRQSDRPHLPSHSAPGDLDVRNVLDLMVTYI